MLNQLALLSIALGALLLLVGAFSAVRFLTGEAGERWAMFSMMLSSACGLVPGGLLYALTRSKQHTFDRREAILLVSLSWILGAGLAGLPFMIWARASGDTSAPARVFASPVNAYFEAMSGLTTTGATVLNRIDALPRGLLLWRAFTHWIGGLGIIVLFVAVLPSLGVGARRLFRFEAPGRRQSAQVARLDLQHVSGETSRLQSFAASHD